MQIKCTDIIASLHVWFGIDHHYLHSISFVVQIELLQNIVKKINAIDKKLDVLATPTVQVSYFHKLYDSNSGKSTSKGCMH